MYVVKDAERAGKGLITLLVDDLDAHVAQLKDRGMVPVPGERRVVVTDPEGNRVTFGQP
jgi:glyoxylase I family protein